MERRYCDECGAEVKPDGLMFDSKHGKGLTLRVGIYAELVEKDGEHAEACDICLPCALKKLGAKTD